MAKIPTTSTTLLRDLAHDSQHARWGEFVARYRPMMDSFMRERFPSLDSDDVVQETLVAVAKALPNYRYAPDEKGHFRNYLVGIVRNKALMALRTQCRDERLKAAYAEESSSSRRYDEASGEAWRKAVFEIALRQLMDDPSIHDRTKQIFIRTAIRQESPEEVAASLGVSRNVVDQQKRRTLAKFKALVSALKGAL